MVTKIHPEPQDLQTTEEEEEVKEEKKEDETPDHSTSPVEFINVISLEPFPVPPKSPSKPRQRGIGLENMKGLDYLQIRQTNRYMEDFANVQNNYDVEKGVGDAQKVFFGMECTAPEVRVKVQSSTIASQPFSLKLVDRDDGSELLLLERNGLNDSPTLVYRMRLRKKEPVGAIMLQFGWRKMSPTFTIFDERGNSMLRLVGPWTGGLGKVLVAKETTFVVQTADKEERRVGSIVKDGDIFEENKMPTTEEEVIRIHFEDVSLDNMSKALILCTAFVLDYTQFQTPSNFKKIASVVCLKCVS